MVISQIAIIDHLLPIFDKYHPTLSHSHPHNHFILIKQIIFLTLPPPLLPPREMVSSTQQVGGWKCNFTNVIRLIFQVWQWQCQKVKHDSHIETQNKFFKLWILNWNRIVKAKERIGEPCYETFHPELLWSVKRSLLEPSITVCKIIIFYQEPTWTWVSDLQRQWSKPSDSDKKASRECFTFASVKTSSSAVGGKRSVWPGHNSLAWRCGALPLITSLSINK